jgi:hypothetical protein
MAVPDHPTFEPGGLAWELSEDAEKHIVNGREQEANNALRVMSTEMMDHGASMMDVHEWIGVIRENAALDHVKAEYLDGPNGPHPEDYVDVTGVYDSSKFVTITLYQFNRLQGSL